MLKTFFVAWREFVSTVWTKGFILGILMTPVILLIVAGGIALLKDLKGPTLKGTIAVIDRAGGVAEGIQSRFSAEAVEREIEKVKQQVQETAGSAAAAMGVPKSQSALAAGAAGKQIEESFAKAELSVEVLDPTTDDAAARQSLADVDIHDKNRPADAAPQRVALAVIPDGAVKPDAKGDYADFELFYAPKIDFEIQKRIDRKIGEAIVDARLGADERIRASGLTAEQIRGLLREPDSKSVTVTKSGEKASTGVLQMFLPMAFMILLMMSVMTGGQYLLTTTVEEKASRVMEVLLSAVSPMQLMVGKIVGQMCVGLLILVVYSGVGVASLIAFSLTHVISPMLLVYLFIFFFIAFFIIASMMAAAGSAVNEMREAQTLMTPIMVIVMLPWLLWLPISRAPNSLFSTVMSFVPGINPFVMMIRLTGSEPPPAWQIPVSIAVGLLSVLICAWAAAKIFRIGVLMYGKPPNLRTLIKWVRMA